MKTRLLHRSGTAAALAAALTLLASSVSCQSTGCQKEAVPRVKATQQGIASWYSIRTNRGTRTASGKPLRNEDATAAHRHLPLGTRVRVTNLTNGKQEIVTITDRGPYIRGRIVDVTVGVAKRLEFHHRGLAPVKIEVLDHSQPQGGPIEPARKRRVGIPASRQRA